VTGGISPKRAVALIKQLPHGSRFVAAQRGGPQYIGWDFDRYLRAALVDAMNNNTHAFIMANTDKKKRKPKAPKSVPTPDVVKAEEEAKKSGQNAFSSQMDMMFNKLKRQEEAAARPPL